MSNLNLSLYHDAGFSTSQMRTLEQFLESSPLHWITLSENGIYEIVLDNLMMSDFRSCPSYFLENHIKGLQVKGLGGRSWHLDFGILFHKMIEIYYQQFRLPNFDMRKWAVDEGMKAWASADLNYHSEHKEYKSIGGQMGFVGLLLAYATRFSAENERIRVIGTEISFGKAKEVYLGRHDIFHSIDGDNEVVDATDAWTWLKCYLSGRIDTLVDDGTSICPMDHKTMGSFRFDPAQRFEMDEGPCGYIYAVNQILPAFLESQDMSGLLNRNCNKIIMNFISKSVPKEGERFKRIPILKTSYQLEEYRKRMLQSGEDIFRALVRYANTGTMLRDTSKCTSWYMHDCPYLAIHRQNSADNQLAVIDSFFERKKIWDTETVNQED